MTSCYFHFVFGFRPERAAATKNYFIFYTTKLPLGTPTGIVIAIRGRKKRLVCVQMSMLPFRISVSCTRPEIIRVLLLASDFVSSISARFRLIRRDVYYAVISWQFSRLAVTVSSLCQASSWTSKL